MPDIATPEVPVVDAIVGREPSWMVRTGITLVFVTVTMLLLLTWFIQYPDSIHAQITLTTQQAPVQLVAKNNGRITDIFVSEGDTVSKGKVLVLLENSVNYSAMVKLKNLLEQANFARLTELDINGLGELQPYVNQLNQALNDSHQFATSAQLSTRISHTQALSKQYQQLQQQLDNKKQTMTRKLVLEADLLTNNRKLKEQGLVTEADLVAIENRYLDKKLALEDISIQRELYNIKIKEFTHQLSEFSLIRQEQTAQLKTALKNSYSALVGKIDEWQQKYLLTAPASGIVSFSNYWSVNQQVNRSDVVVSIANENSVKVGKMLLDQQGAGKVKPGQKVSIELASFPALEFGKLEGSVKAISLIPGQQGYMLDVTLPQKLITTYGKLLPFSPNLLGTAKIVTQEKRLFERFLDKILYAFDNI